MTADWSPLWLAFRAAGLSTAVALTFGPWLAYVSRRQRAAPLAWLPLSLAPSLLFAYCLLETAFRWPIAALVASAFSLPYLMRAAAAAYGSLNPDYANAARGLGASEWRVFSRIAAPLALRPILSAAAFVFATVATDCGVILILVRAFRTPGPLPAAPLAAIGAIGLAVHYLGSRLEAPRLEASRLDRGRMGR
ncbi:MAG: ABC transporter permease subunit [Bryobacteraceae bacterium]